MEAHALTPLRAPRTTIPAAFIGVLVTGADDGAPAWVRDRARAGTSRATLCVNTAGARRVRYNGVVPITPFHFGPGLLGKGFAAPWYSWTEFVAANVGIDFESLYYLSRDEWPVHRQLHTFLGAGVMGIVTALLLIGARALVPALHHRLRAASPTVSAEVSTLGIVGIS